MQHLRPAYLILTLFIFFAYPVYALSDIEQIKGFSAIGRETTGLDWLQMSFGERTEYILASMAILTKNGIPLEKSPDDYCSAVEEKLRFNPGLYSSTITSILASCVHEKGPSAQHALDQLGK